MQKIFFDSRILDTACRERFCLSEDLMMENAAMSLEEKLHDKKSVLILCGGGNNGGDGYALARRIGAKKNPTVIVCVPEKSEMCILQKKRAEKSGVKFTALENAASILQNADFDAIVDCVFGSALDEKVVSDMLHALEQLSVRHRV